LSSTSTKSLIVGNKNNKTINKNNINDNSNNKSKNDNNIIIILKFLIRIIFVNLQIDFWLSLIC